MSVTVAKEGNQRVGEMTADEFTQCVHDILSWFQRSGYERERFRPASPVDIQRFCKAVDDVPAGLEAFLNECNGGLWFGEKLGLSTEGIIELIGEIDHSDIWNPSLIPFCGDSSALLAINRKSGKVVEWDSDDGSGEVLSESLNEYLEDYRNALLSGRYEFIDDIGVVEKVSAVKPAVCRK
jgi:hypothetical protein